MAKKNNLTQKKGVFNVDEVQAYRVAYGRKLTSKDFISFVGLPAFVLGLFSFLVLYNLWVTIPLVVIGLIYGFRRMLPNVIRRQYERQSFAERNKFLNNITQVLTDQSQTVSMAVAKVTERASGEFREHLEQYHAMITGADNAQIRRATIWFSDMYEDDVIFGQYIEQLETIIVEGKTNVDTLKDIKTYHNDIKSKQMAYERLKNGHVGDLQRILLLTLLLIGALAFSFGFQSYLDAFARSIVGYVAGGIYLAFLSRMLHQFTVFLFDDSIMEVRVK